MVAIHTVEDFIHALREDPDLLDQVRRTIMTDEVLALPNQFAALLQTQNRILAELAESRRTQTAMQETIATILETQNSLLQAQNRISEDIRALHGMFRQQHEDFGRFRGNYAIDAARQNENSTLWYKLEERKLEPLDPC